MGTTVAEINNARSAAFPPYQEELQELTSVIDRRAASFKRIALRVLGNAADAEDAVQDAFLSAYKHLDQFRGRAQMSTWLTTIVVNAARMKARERSRRVQIAKDVEDQDEGRLSFWDAISDRRPTPEEVYQRREGWERLAQLLTWLSPPLRRTFQLRVVDGLTIRETAHSLGVPVGTVKARLARARIKLKQLMQKSLRGKCRAIPGEAVADTNEDDVPRVSNPSSPIGQRGLANCQTGVTGPASINALRDFVRKEAVQNDRRRGRVSYGSRAHSVHNLRDSSGHLVFSPTNKTFGELRHDLPDDAEVLEAMER